MFRAGSVPAAPLKVAVLTRRSLFAAGIASRLREHAELLEVQLIRAEAAEALVQLAQLEPAILLMDSTDVEAVTGFSLLDLWERLPRVRVVFLDPVSDHVRVCGCDPWLARGSEGLIAVMQQVSSPGASLTV